MFNIVFVGECNGGPGRDRADSRHELFIYLIDYCGPGCQRRPHAARHREDDGIREGLSGLVVHGDLQRQAGSGHHRQTAGKHTPHHALQCARRVAHP